MPQGAVAGIAALERDGFSQNALQGWKEQSRSRAAGWDAGMDGAAALERCGMAESKGSSPLESVQLPSARPQCH